ncbi:hypothetical protein YA0871_12700 [Pseudomonas paralactis]|uniref:Uncharacterized protein n=1 Tax=Pseudomonas paralactis TaxID=1615673 RepID=A0ABS0UZQ8_9PSED|nr:hypothetical protein [Pseudomonas paralactis]MBJ2220717.1 hypothetical protein [Pseudomonas sp. MF7453]
MGSSPWGTVGGAYYFQRGAGWQGAVKRAEYRQFMGEVGEQDWRWYLHQA